MPITLKEIARRAGVHPSTASRVATNDTSYQIAPETRAKIEKVLVETGYRPHAIARGLKLQRLKVLAVVVPDITNPIYASMFRGVEDVANADGHSVILCNTDASPERELAHVQSMRNGRADGCILAAARLHDPVVTWMRKEHVPHVLVNRWSDERGLFVGIDDELGARLATEHLLDLGHRRIAHLGGPHDTSTGTLRRRGYRAALQSADIEVDPTLDVDAQFLEQSAYEAMLRLLQLKNRPTAVFAASDRMALGAYRAAAERGLEIPREISVIGFSDVPLAQYVHPTLSTIRVPFDQIGGHAARMLLSALAARNLTARRHELLRPELVRRASTDRLT